LLSRAVARWPVAVAALAALVALVLVAGCARPAPPPAVAEPPPDEPRRGGTLVIAMAWEPDPVLDPYQLGWGHLPLDMFEGLLATTWDFKPGPGIAERWEFQDGGRVQVYYLRDDKYFHDGTKVNAEAVKRYFELLISEEVDAPGRWDFAFISDMEVLDEYVLKMTLEKPFPAALNNFGWGGGWGYRP